MDLYMETWWKVWCPECDKPNWVCGGNMQDLTTIDVEGFECWDCEHKTCFIDDDMLDFECRDITDNVYYKRGKESPVD